MLAPTGIALPERRVTLHSGHKIYPTRLRCVGTGLGSAWLRAGSAIGPVLVGLIVGDLGIRYVFAAFAGVALVGGLVTLLFAIETKGRVLEELSP